MELDSRELLVGEKIALESRWVNGFAAEPKATEISHQRRARPIEGINRPNLNCPRLVGGSSG